MTLWSLQAFDCGAGVDTSSSGVSFSPTPASLTVSISDSGTKHSCANGVMAIIYNVTAAANLSTTPAGSFSAMDNSLALTATIRDSATGGAHVLLPSPVTSVAVTRRLWTVAAPAATSYLSLGPQLFAGGTGGLYAIAPATGVLSTWQSGDPSNAVIAPNNGTPAVFIADPTTQSAPVGLFVTAGNASSTTTSAFGSCNMKPLGSAGTDTYAILGYELSGSASINAQVTRSHCTASNNACCLSLGDPSGCGATLDAACCTSWSISSFQGAIALSAGAVASCSTPLSGASGSACAGAPNPPAISTPVSTASGLFVGANPTPAWVVTNSGGTVLGTWAGTAAVHGWPLVDGSPTPVAYLPDVAAGGIDAVQIGSSGFGTRLYNLSPPFPSAISDMTLSSGGILYVLSSNNVYAIITDSTGSEANQASAWPLRCHDPCRSSLAGFSCPY